MRHIEGLRWMFIERLSQINIEDIPKGMKEQTVKDYRDFYNEGKELDLTEQDIDRMWNDAQMCVAYP